MKKDSLYFWPIAGGILLFALASAFHIQQPFVNGSQFPNWAFTYELGYNHRGFMGALFDIIHGEPTIPLLQKIIPTWDRTAYLFIILLCWGLLFYPLSRLQAPSDMRLLLFAFAALCLLSPAWKFQTTQVGFLDKFVFLNVLFALVALISRKPILFALFNIIGFLVHPSMIFYQIIFGGMIIHALLNYPRYREKSRRWLAAIAVILGVSFALYLLNTPENNVAMLGKVYTSKLDIDNVTADFLSPGTNNRNVIYALMTTYPKVYLFTAFVFFVLPVMLVLFFTFKIRQNNLFCGTYPNTSFLPPLMNKYKGLIQRGDVYLLFLMSMAIFLPVTIVSQDFVRHLYWSYWGAMLVYIYLLQCAPPPPT